MPHFRGTRKPKRTRARRHDRRESASKRGYDREWAKLRHSYASEHPLCEHCQRQGLTVPVHEVDHILPFNGPGDPLRLDRSNLQSLCRPCHAKKTAQDQR